MKIITLLSEASISGFISIIYITMILFFIIYVLLYIIDSYKLPTKKGIGTIIIKNNEEIFLNEDATTSYALTILVNDVNLYDEILVGKEYFDMVEEKQELNISYSVGRIRKTVFIKNII